MSFWFTCSYFDIPITRYFRFARLHMFSPLEILFLLSLPGKLLCSPSIFSFMKPSLFTQRLPPQLQSVTSIIRWIYQHLIIETSLSQLGHGLLQGTVASHIWLLCTLYVLEWLTWNECMRKQNNSWILWLLCLQKAKLLEFLGINDLENLQVVFLSAMAFQAADSWSTASVTWTILVTDGSLPLKVSCLHFQQTHWMVFSLLWSLCITMGSHRIRIDPLYCDNAEVWQRFLCHLQNS